MGIRVYRYTFNGRGLIQAMDEIDDLVNSGVIDTAEERYMYRRGEEPLNMLLPEPPVCKEREVRCWFTEEGNKYFKYPLQVISDVFNKYLGDKAKVVVESKVYDGPILYQDDFQIVVPA